MLASSLWPASSKSEVDALWIQHCGPPEQYSAPWLIHPGVTNRVRRGHSADHAVFFAQWSAMMDDDARTVIRSAAGWARENPDRDVVLVRYVGPAARRRCRISPTCAPA